jgi:uncharacterized lipoprotein YajG
MGSSGRENPVTLNKEVIMRSLTIFAGLFLLAGSHAALSADAADRPIMVAAAQNVRAASVSVTASRANRETSVPEGSLEKFGSVGLPQ